MSKEEYLQIAASKYDALQNLKSETNFYDYEKGFDEIWIELGREVLENNIGKVPKDHRKKTLYRADTGQ
jgi:hypothetical protein